MTREEPMAPLRLHGRTLRCWWCGKRIDREPRQVRVEIGGKQHEAAACSEEHSAAVADAYQYVQKVFPLLPVGLAICLLLLIGSNFSACQACFVAAGFFTIGATMMVCSFGTPQTVRSVGMKNSIAVVRLLGIAAIAVAFVFLWRLLS